MVYEHGQSITLTGQGPIETQATKNEYTNTKHFETQWECEYMIEGMADQLRSDIIKGNAIVVSDGSFQWGNGVAAWTIEGSTARNQIRGAGRTPVKQWIRVHTKANFLACGEFFLHSQGLHRNIRLHRDE